MKNQTMSKTFTLRAFAALLAASALGAAAADDKARDPREFNYVQLAGGMALSSSANVNIGLGSGVQLPGQAYYDRGNLWNITLGRQFLREEDEEQKQKRLQAGATTNPQQDERQPMRIELELWNASVKRNTIAVAAQIVRPNDNIKPTALFVNAAIPIAQSDELYTPEDPKRLPEPLWRTWLGAGVGFAKLSYPGASAISGCNCLREASGNGLTFQVKLQAERQVNENTYLFAQLGRVWLPAVNTTQGAQHTEYGRWGINNLAIGVRWAFRD